MAHVSDLIATDIEQYLKSHEHKSLLRFITCGSVDDGKSTLIGRLLYESKMLFEDQLAALEADSHEVRHPGRASSTSRCWWTACAAEREQGITIDVAYRFFSTDRRKFIVADTPGHEQYTRNMVTGASTADVGRDPDRRAQGRADADAPPQLPGLAAGHPPGGAGHQQDGPGRTTAEQVFDKIVRGLPRVRRSRSAWTKLTVIPVSAFKGDNIVEPSEQHALVPRPTLMGYLETVRDRRIAHAEDAVPPAGAVGQPPQPRLPRLRRHARQRQGANSGDRIRVLPSGKESTVTRIVTFDGDLRQAVAGQSVTLTLADEIDISRGDVISHRAGAGRGGRPVRGHADLDARRAAAARPPLPDEDRHADRHGLGHRHQVPGEREHAGARGRQDAGARTRSASATSSSTGRSPSTRTRTTARPAASS